MSRRDIEEEGEGDYWCPVGEQEIIDGALNDYDRKHNWFIRLAERWRDRG